MKFKLRVVLGLAVASAISFLSFASGAHASSIDVQYFVPSSGYEFVYSEDALMDSRKGFSLGVTYDYLRDPLIRTNFDSSQETVKVLNGLHTLDLGGAYRLTNRIKLGLALPLEMVTVADPNSSQFALSDMRAFLKYRLTEDDHAETSYALMLDMRFPTGNGTYFLSDDSLGVGFRFIAEHDFHFMQLAANAGFFYASNSTAPGENLSYRQRIPLSLSARIPVAPRWAINLEGSGAVPIPLNSYQNPGEVYLGAQYTDEKALTLFAGGALGKIPGDVGSDDYRIIVGLRASFENDEKPRPAPAPVVAAVEPPPAPKKPRVVFTATHIEINQEIRFETAKDVLTPASKELLDEVSHVIKDHLKDFKKIAIEGHTDRHGGDLYNLNLSKARAKAVRLYLTSTGIEDKRFTSTGYGKRRPKVTSGMSDVEMDAANRRVEFKVIQ